MTDATTLRETVWGSGTPLEIRRLERALHTAFHAFDDISEMDLAHRARVVTEITGDVLEASALAGHGAHSAWAATVLLLAAQNPPAWASLCQRWDDAIDAGLALVAADARPQLELRSA